MKDILEKLASLQHSQILFLEELQTSPCDYEKIRSMYVDLEEIQALIKEIEQNDSKQ